MGSLKNDNKALRLSKEKVRARVRKAFKAQAQDELDRQSRLIQEKLENLPVYRQAKVLMFYWALPGEVETERLIRKAKEEKKTVTLPVVIDKGTMQPYEFRSSSELVTGAFGVRQPDGRFCRRIEVERLDAVIVPGAAFDMSGKRLGRGKGYYDTFLRGLKAKAVTIGLAFDHQIVEDLPFDPLQDRKVDHVIRAQ
jgi:5-formyltetrahydrofolate cyclo-ligase